MNYKPQMTSKFRGDIASSLGVTESTIKDLVHSFYAKVRVDPLIGPIFQKAIGDDWDEHLVIMCDFWSGVVLATGRYKGQPLLKHVALPGLQAQHFARWLELFEENAYNICQKDAAELFISRAIKIADSLMQGIAFYRDKLDK